MSAPQKPPSVLPEPGLCAICIHSTRIRSDRGSLFYRCDRSRSEPEYPKYPPLPVLRGPGYEPVADA